MVNRREFFGISLGAGATMALTPQLLRALQQSGGRLSQRAVPSSGQMLALNARSETRLQDPRGPVFEFQLDGQGKVTGAILEQQGPQGPVKVTLERR